MNASTLMSDDEPAHDVSGLNEGMPTLEERLSEVMQAMNWKHKDLMRVSGQSSSVVSQWLGKGAKIIHTITKLEALLAIERESGFSALWVGVGKGPKMAPTRRGPDDPFHVQQITEWARQMPPAKLLKLHATAHNIMFSPDDTATSEEQTADHEKPLDTAP